MKTALTYLLGWITISLISMSAYSDPILSFLLNTSFSLFVAIDYADCAANELHRDRDMIFLGTEYAENSDHALFLAFQQLVNSLNRPMSSCSY